MTLHHVDPPLHSNSLIETPYPFRPSTLNILMNTQHIYSINVPIDSPSSSQTHWVMVVLNIDQATTNPINETVCLQENSPPTMRVITPYLHPYPVVKK